MSVRGSKPAVRALEDEGVRFAFGIPGTHNIELYDALEDSSIQPVLVTDEQSASFMADGVSRSSDQVGVANVVPGAGITHAMSGIAEAYLDQVPIVVLTCGIRNDTGAAFQLHDVDQLALLRPVTKGAWRVDRAEEIYPTIRRAFALARRAPAGPTAVEIPANLYMLTHDVPEPSWTPEPSAPVAPDAAKVREAAAILGRAKRPLLYVGNGARDAADAVVKLAESLGAPVATTIQGKGVFPETHPLWLWCGLGAMAPPFVRDVQQGCDAMLAVGCRFAEVGTGSYGLDPPATLIHADVDPSVFDRNYKATLAVETDARLFAEALLAELAPRGRDAGLEAAIAAGHQKVRREQAAPGADGKVGPGPLFSGLQRHAGEGAIWTADSGNGTFLAMEHLRLDGPRRFLAPVDYSCMGYAVPAALGAKLANTGRDVIALVGDGALLMTGLEMLTASASGIGVVCVVLRDEELAQIAQFQRTALNRDTASRIAPYEVEAYASAVRCRYLRLDSDARAGPVAAEALAIARRGEPVVVEARIDYSRKTYFTRGVVKTNLLRLPWGERFRMVGRALGRRIAGR
jgi:acetolactate synthase I/II/III large subunit